MEGSFVADVAEAMKSKETRIFHAIDVYVVNFEAKVPFPRKFLYKACKSCRKSLDDRTRIYEHHGDRVQAHLAEKRYRFDVYISDAVQAAQPIRATLFDGAESLLGPSALEFAGWDKKAQKVLVRETVYSIPRCVVKLKTNSNGQAVIGSLRRKGASEKSVNIAWSESPVTPIYRTPPKEVGSSGSRQRGKDPESAMRDKVNKVTEMLMATFLQEEHTFLGEDDGIQGSW